MVKPNEDEWLALMLLSWMGALVLLILFLLGAPTVLEATITAALLMAGVLWLAFMVVSLGYAARYFGRAFKAWQQARRVVLRKNEQSDAASGHVW